MAYSPRRRVLVISGWTASELEALRAYETAAARPWSRLLGVSVDPANPDGSGSRPLVAGRYRVEDEALTFRPRYGWSPGVRYRAQLDPGAFELPPARASGLDARRAHQTSFEIPPLVAEGPPPKVAAVYPTEDRVPENLLRLYVEFSRPMRRGDVRENVVLLDSTGARVKGSFLHIGHELWSPDMRWLTLVLDPGRIKRGVAPNRQVGPPLSASSTYELLIGPGLVDAHGRPLTSAHRKRFSVSRADRSGPDPSRWRLTAPSDGRRDALTIELHEPVDPLLASRLVAVTDPEGQPIPGTITARESERVLEFSPRMPWTAGHYYLRTDPTLEDYAGNQVRNAFDMPEGSVAAIAATSGADASILRPFEIGDAPAQW